MVVSVSNRSGVNCNGLEFDQFSSHSCKIFKSKHRRMRQSKRGRHIRKKEEMKERVKADMEEIGKGQKHIREGQEQIRQKFQEIESECHKLKEESMNIAKQSARNQIRINLMLNNLKASQDNNLVQAHHLTQLLREEMGKQKQGN